MRRLSRSIPRPALLAVVLTTTMGLATAVAGFADLPEGPATIEQVTLGRQLVLSRDCAGCHSHGKHDPGDPQWLSGFVTGRDEANGLPFQIGPFKTYPSNLTPDNLTGLGRISARQIFNALRYGLKPGDTPDLVITSNTPGQGNFPATPKYLAPPMPWPSWRHMRDDELWAIAAYLKHGIKPVANKVAPSEGPPDFWAGGYVPQLIGPIRSRPTRTATRSSSRRQPLRRPLNERPRIQGLAGHRARPDPPNPSNAPPRGR